MRDFLRVVDSRGEQRHLVELPPVGSIPATRTALLGGAGRGEAGPGETTQGKVFNCLAARAFCLLQRSASERVWNENGYMSSAKHYTVFAVAVYRGKEVERRNERGTRRTDMASALPLQRTGEHLHTADGI